MLDAQDYLCAICKGGPDGRGRLHVDHDHESGRVRGLLCSNCNLGLGKFKDDPALVREAARYLLRKDNDISTITKTADIKILGVLKRGPKKGLTATAIADRGSLNLNTTRSALTSLQGEGLVTVVGVGAFGGRGRPSNFYALAT